MMFSSKYWSRRGLSLDSAMFDQQKQHHTGGQMVSERLHGMRSSVLCNGGIGWFVSWLVGWLVGWFINLNCLQYMDDLKNGLIDWLVEVWGSPDNCINCMFYLVHIILFIFPLDCILLWTFFSEWSTLNQFSRQPYLSVHHRGRKSSFSWHVLMASLLISLVMSKIRRRVSRTDGLRHWVRLLIEILRLVLMWPTLGKWFGNQHSIFMHQSPIRSCMCCVNLFIVY